MTSELLALLTFSCLMILFNGCTLFFHKRWGKMIIPTFICGNIPFLFLAPSFILFPDYLFFDLLYKAIGIAFSFFVVIHGLKNQNNTALLKEKSFLYTLITLLLLMAAFSLYFRFYINSFPLLNLALTLFSYVLLSPFVEEILYRELLFKLVMGKKKQVVFPLFFLFSLLGGVGMHVSQFGVPFALVVSLLFFILYIIRYFFRKNSQFFIPFLIHALFNFFSNVYHIVVKGVQIDASSIWNLLTKI